MNESKTKSRPLSLIININIFTKSSRFVLVHLVFKNGEEEEILEKESYTRQSKHCRFCIYLWAVLGDTGLYLVHNCTIFLCSLDVRNIDDQCRGPNVKEKDHLDG